MNSLKHTLDMMWNESARSLPTILTGILILVGGWIIAKIIQKVVYKLLSFAKGHKAMKVLSADLLSEKLNIKVDLPLIFSKIMYWIIFLFFVVAATETFGWANVSEEISKFIMYIPRILSAVLIFAIGYTIASFIRTSMKSVSTTMGAGIGAYLSDILFYFMLVIIIVTALSQAGVDVSVISSHMFIIVGAFAATFALSFGLGSREVVTDLVKNFYNRKVLKVGDKIKLNGIEGSIEMITRTSIVVRDSKGKTVIPSKEFYEHQYEIID